MKIGLVIGCQGFSEARPWSAILQENRTTNSSDSWRQKSRFRFLEAKISVSMGDRVISDDLNVLPSSPAFGATFVRGPERLARPNQAAPRKVRARNFVDSKRKGEGC